MDLSNYRVIDSHCHPFLPDKESKPFEAYLTLSDIQQQREDTTSTMFYRMVVRELTRVLCVEPNMVIDERQRRIKRDPEEYIRLLFDDASLDMLLVDTGYPFPDYVGYEVDLNSFSEMIGREVREIFRLEAAVYLLVKNIIPFHDAVEDLRNQISYAVRDGAVALKSVIAYRTGLAIKSHNDACVKAAWEDLLGLVRSGRRPRDILPIRNEKNKAIFDYFLRIGLEEAARLAVPLQIHTGMGDSPSMDLRLANPANLYDLLQEPIAKQTKIVLTHGGYPYLEEAAFLVNAYPNLYLDMSETIPFISIGIDQRLRNLMEVAPTTKIMHGSDGFNIPEIYWFAAKQVKRSLGRVLSSIAEWGDIDSVEAESIAEGFLYSNAKRLYHL